MADVNQWPEMKQESDLVPGDFQHHPVWIGVHHYDADQPWYEKSDEETFRAWDGKLPFSEDKGTALVAAHFDLADGSVYSGYCRAVPKSWDVPQSPAPSWSVWHGGSPLSVLALLNPTIFIDDHPFNFHLGIPDRRRDRVKRFYAAIEKKPAEVFPLHFAMSQGLFKGVITGKLDGFFYFPLGGAPYEIDGGESLLRQGGSPAASPEHKASSDTAGHCTVIRTTELVDPSQFATRELKSAKNLSLSDFEQHPVWILAEVDRSRPIRPKHMFKPWAGPFPVDSGIERVLIPATFALRDGNRYRGYLRAAPENWLDVIPPELVLPRGRIIKQEAPRVRFGGSPLAIVGEQIPCMFIAGQRFEFWCGVRDVDELRLPFYNALQKQADAIFPIHFEGDKGLATGIVAGELDGFYETGFRNGQPPKVVR